MPHGRLHRFVRTTLHTSGQFAVRVIIMILAALVALSILLDLDMLLGAFAAGVIWKLIMRNAPERDREQVDSKVEAIAFGFLVPIFFVYTGVTFDLEALLASPMALACCRSSSCSCSSIRGHPLAALGAAGRVRPRPRRARPAGCDRAADHRRRDRHRRRRGDPRRRRSPPRSSGRACSRCSPSRCSA